MKNEPYEEFEQGIGNSLNEAHQNMASGKEDMIFVYDIRCEVIENEFCPYIKREYKIGGLTPGGMCAASFAAIWPFASAMRHSEKTAFENSQGQVTISCPDGWVQFRLSRIRPDESSLLKPQSSIL